METSTIKALFDACYLAKRSRDLLPPLPPGVTPSHTRMSSTRQKNIILKSRKPKLPRWI